MDYIRYLIEYLIVISLLVVYRFIKFYFFESNIEYKNNCINKNKIKKKIKKRNRNRKINKKETNFNEYYFIQRTLTRSNSFPSNDRIELNMTNSLFIDKSKDVFLPDIHAKMNLLNHKIKWSK